MLPYSIARMGLDERMAAAWQMCEMVVKSEDLHVCTSRSPDAGEENCTRADKIRLLVLI